MDRDKKIKVLNSTDISVYPDVFAPLDEVAETISISHERENIIKEISNCDAFFSSLYTFIDSEILEHAKKLKVIATPSTGTDHIDLNCAKSKGIEIISLKNDTEFLDKVTSTAEQAWALLLGTVRKTPWAFDAAKKGHWARNEFRGHQISGMTLGILGYGRLGKIVADYGNAFRMRVIACDVKKIESSSDVEMVDFNTLMKESDVLSIHIHLDETTKDLINSEVFSKMKRGVVIINTSRGGIIDEKAFIEALDSGQISTAGIDVLNGEWDKNLCEHPLVQYANTHENLLISPHIGGVTHEAQEMTMSHTVRKLKSYLIENLIY